jgi:ribosomal protein S18 acetylase RimI-like enzyme
MHQFRKALVTDSQIITDFVNSAYRGESSKVGWTTEADLLGGQRTDQERIKELISESDTQIELLTIDDELSGLVLLKKEKHFAYFGMLTVKPNLQNKGVGKMILDHVEKQAKSWGLSKIKMTVISDRKELISFYERRGYQWTGETENFPEHDQRFGIPKKKLIFHVFEKII